MVSSRHSPNNNHLNTSLCHLKTQNPRMNTCKTTPKHKIKVIGDFILKEKISETPFSSVWRANHIINTDLKDVALKKISLSKLTPNLKASLDCEINFLYTVNHPNIIRLLDIFQNILLSSSDSSTLLKIADFGLSRILQPGDYAETVCRSPLYMAPEMVGFQRYDDKVDLWSIGAILFELLNGYPPFHGRTNVQLLKNIKTSTGLPFPELIRQTIHPDCF